MMRAKTLQILLAVLAITGFGLTMRADDAAKPSKSERAAIQVALKEFNSWIGGWRGGGQVRRGSTRGAWVEKSNFVWKFDGDQIGIEYNVDGAKHVKSGLLSWDVKNEEYTFDAELADKSKRKYRGELEKGVLALESGANDAGYVSRLTMRQLNEKRFLVLYERRKAKASFYLRVGEVGYTREGTRLAASDNTGPICIVTGGAGTIRVSFKGKNYYVCCSGCRDAFNDDPEGIIETYLAELAEKKKSAAN
jgi:YHS domain-containing protein